MPDGPSSLAACLQNCKQELLFSSSTRAGPFSAVHWQLLYMESGTAHHCLTLLVGIYGPFRDVCSSVPLIHLKPPESACLHNLHLYQVWEVCCVKIYLLKSDLNQAPLVSSTASWLSYSGSWWIAWRKGPKGSNCSQPAGWHPEVLRQQSHAWHRLSWYRTNEISCAKVPELCRSFLLSYEPRMKEWESR